MYCSLLDESLKLSEAYITGKRELKEKKNECDITIAIASCDHLQHVCVELYVQVSDLEVTLVKCKVKLETTKFSLLEKDEDTPSDIEQTRCSPCALFI